MTIDKLDLSIRSYHSFKHARITHVEQLLKMSYQELLNLK